MDEVRKPEMQSNPLADQIAACAEGRPAPLVAHTFIERPASSSYSRPVWLECEDGNIYVVKGQHAGRAVFNEHAVGILGVALGAPVPMPAQVLIPQELTTTEPRMADITPGVAHGASWIRDTGDKQWLAYTDKLYNRARFALLSILYGWLSANDHQLIYSNQEPFRVHSVDHGHFFPKGPDWTEASLAGSPRPQPYAEIVNGCSLSEQETQQSLDALAAISSDQIAEAMGFPPDEWGVSMPERVALGKFIASRQGLLSNGHIPKSGDN